MQLLNNVYQIAGPLYAVHQNVFAVRSRKSVILVDAGLGEQDYALILKNLRYWQLTDYPVSHVLLTHEHIEHCGNAHRFKHKGATIVAHSAAAEAIESCDDRVAGYAHIDAGPFAPCNVDIRVDHGAVIQVDELNFEVIHVPGHSDGSVLYRLNIDGRTILFTGDTVLASLICRTSALGWTGGVDYDQDAYVESLKAISLLPADVVLPGHGEICMRKGSNLLVGAYLQARLTFLAGNHH